MKVFSFVFFSFATISKISNVGLKFVDVVLKFSCYHFEISKDLFEFQTIFRKLVQISPL